MLEQAITTYFAPAERAPVQQVKELSKFVQHHPLFQAILDSIDGYLMILNPERQVLAMNNQLIKDLKIQQPKCLIGQRPGEILGCIHAIQGPGGCGTSEACKNCGAVISIVDSQKTGQTAVNECLATVKHGEITESHEFSVRSTPVKIGEHTFTVIVFHDISGEKRREVLERTFFHDILNTVGGLMGWSSLFISYTNSTNPQEVAEHILSLSQRLKQEIEDQRRLVQAENGTLAIKLEGVSVQQIFKTIQSVFEAHQVAKGRKLLLQEVDPKETLVTDTSILARILTNMIKNAFEASQDGDIVKIWYERTDRKGTFYVQNPGVMPPDVQLQMFKRSFSTKGEKGRGIGTYSMKLFGERYLNGQVDFESSPDKGTVFYFQLSTDGPYKN
jgi:hypothetical protein